MKYEVIKEFPGLKIGDILTEEEGTGFYVNRKEDVDVSEAAESVYINSIALSKDVVENEKEYFRPVVEMKPKEEVKKLSEKDKKINDIMQVATYLESDLLMAVNPYHEELLGEMINRAYRDASLLQSTN